MQQIIVFNLIAIKKPFSVSVNEICIVVYCKDFIALVKKRKNENIVRL